MPNVSSKSQVVRSGQKSKADIHRDQPQSIARDDLRTAYAGDQNKGPAKDQKERVDDTASTSLKGRRIDKNEDKTPVR